MAINSVRCPNQWWIIIVWKNINENRLNKSKKKKIGWWFPSLQRNLTAYSCNFLFIYKMLKSLLWFLAWCPLKIGNATIIKFNYVFSLPETYWTPFFVLCFIKTTQSDYICPRTYTSHFHLIIIFESLDTDGRIFVMPFQILI